MSERRRGSGAAWRGATLPALAILVGGAVGCTPPALPFVGTLDGGIAPADSAHPGGGGIDLALPPPSEDLAVPPVTGVDLAFVLPVGGLSGDPCQQNTDCAGMKPVCILKDGQGHVWPGGYCSSRCDPAKDDPMTGVNPECPGISICSGQGNQGSCLAYCSSVDGPTPCSRAGYSCFYGCQPSSLSMCDPTTKGTCGGGETCLRVGSDAVGDCLPSCDPFAKNTCAPQFGAPACCYGTFDTGEGFCLGQSGNASDGQPCRFWSDCACGTGCYYNANGNNAVCRPFCGGPNKVACMNGKQCTRYSPAVPISTAGVCGA